MILFVGRIEPLKGIKTLLQSIGNLRENGKSGKDLCLAVIGGELEGKDGQESEDMKLLNGLRDEYGLGDMVTFLGKRSQDSLPYYYSAAELVVMPVPAAVWMGLSMLGGLGVVSRFRNRRRA